MEVTKLISNADLDEFVSLYESYIVRIDDARPSCFTQDVDLISALKNF